MKLTTPLLMTFILATGTAVAQPPGPGKGRMDIERMAILLDLDEYQKTEVERILAEQHDAAAALREQGRTTGERPSREERESHREQMQQETLTKLQAVLTEPQIAKFQALTERPDGRQREHRPQTSE